MNNIDVVFLGDSLTSGYGVKRENFWINKIIKHYKLNSINNGINGDTTPSMLSRIDTDVLSYNPKIIFIMGGSNDILLGRSVESIIKNINLMINEFINTDSKLLVGIPPFIVSSMAYNYFSENTYYSNVENNLFLLKTLLIKLCNNYSLNFIDFFTPTINKQDLYLDGIHLNTIGNNLLFKIALPYFNL